MVDESPGAQLREAALALDPARIGLTQGQGLGPVWGFVMDSTFEDSANWFSLVALADGSTSLYTSGLFAIIGGGNYRQVRRANAALLQLVAGALESLEPMGSTALPPSGMVTLRALTFDGPKAISVKESELHNESLVGQVYSASHNVISVLRSLPEVGM